MYVVLSYMEIMLGSLRWKVALLYMAMSVGSKMHVYSLYICNVNLQSKTGIKIAVDPKYDILMHD